MNSPFAFCLLVVFAAVGFQEVSSDEFDDWDTDYAIIEDITDPYGDSIDDSVASKGIRDKLKTLKVKKKCDCSGKVCGCCLLLEFEQKTYHKACFNVTEKTDLKSVELSLVLDSNKLYAKPIVEKERCVNVPYTSKIAKMCINMYNMKVDEKGLHACAKINLRLFSKQAVSFDFQCLLINKKLISVEKPSEDPDTAILNINIGKNLTVPLVTLG